jgi:fructose-1,6-bisphosphatase I
MIKVSRFITLDNFITKQEKHYVDASGEFTSFMHDLTFAVRLIAREVRSAGINDIIGLTNDVNVHGEQVKKLDVIANVEIIQIPSKYPKGKYVLVFDPLDGSSNIDVNVTIGTIFGLYMKISKDGEDGTNEDVLQPGYKQIAAGYALYGSSTVFVYTTGNGVNAFTYDPTIGEFILSYEGITIPERGKYYSTNEGNTYKWSQEFKNYINHLKEKSDDETRPYTARYIGSGVADIHRTLLYGGIFAYPADNNHPNGKLRLVYECNPLAMLIEQAGGLATNGKDRILDLQPQNIHERSPLFLGSKYDVEECMAFLNGTK